MIYNIKRTFEIWLIHAVRFCKTTSLINSFRINSVDESIPCQRMLLYIHLRLHTYLFLIPSFFCFCFWLFGFFLFRFWMCASSVTKLQWPSIKTYLWINMRYKKRWLRMYFAIWFWIVWYSDSIASDLYKTTI